jgi:hypothetical protein
MKYYSQKDPAYSDLKLGKSKLTIGGFGCFLCSIATLYQRDPRDLLNIAGGVTDAGLVDSDRLARACGGSAERKTGIIPKGWCIAMTRDYAEQGYPTHFFCVNMDKGEQVDQIDPLDYPAKPEPLTYKIDHFRPFANVVLNTAPDTPEDEDLKNAIRLVSDAWKDVESAQEKLHEANNVLRSLL